MEVDEFRYILRTPLPPVIREMGAKIANTEFLASNISHFGIRFRSEKFEISGGARFIASKFYYYYYYYY